MRRLMRRLVVVLALGAFFAAAPPGAAAQAPAAPAGEHWLRLSRSAHTVWAMVGDRVVYRAPATFGKPGYETPLGTHRIGTRVFNETMDSATLGVPRDAAEGYYLKNIYYTQYFTSDGIALHSNYWQPDWVFGSANTSHGCVGLRIEDARYFWNFVGPDARLVIEP
jgi:lipoprotein-anchoring transpeptidase ErfK/SrfK